MNSRHDFFRHRAMSNLVSSLLLISIAIGASATVYGAFNGLVASANPPSARLQINEERLVRGTDEATLDVQLVNLGSQQTTPLSLGLSGVQPSTLSFSITVTLTSLSNGIQLYSGSFAVLAGSTTLSHSFNAGLPPNLNCDFVLTFAPSSAGAALFAVGSTYNLVISTQPHSQASILPTAAAP